MTEKQKTPRPLDVFLGTKIRDIRIAKGMSLAALGRALGISWQQVQKYEVGDNRVAASRLYDIAVQLGTTMEELFDDYGGPRLKPTGIDPFIQAEAEEFAVLAQRLPKDSRAALLDFIATIPASDN